MECPVGRTNADLKPLHIDIHGGGFIGGFPEQGARWCAYLSDQSGAVVISCTYRIAPNHVYPAAHDDIDDIIAWLLDHAQEFGANANLCTIGGSSVGGSLALSATHTMQKNGKAILPLAWLGFYTPVDFRREPKDKPKPPGFPTYDPFSFLLPMYDIYAGTQRMQSMRDARLHPILADVVSLPANMLFVVAGIDILRHEQMTLIEKVKRCVDPRRDASGGIEVMLVDNGFHGFLECKHFYLQTKSRVHYLTDASASFDNGTGKDGSL